MKTITLRLEDDLHKAFKLYAIKKDATMQKILISYIKYLVDSTHNESKNKEDITKGIADLFEPFYGNSK